MNIFVFLLRSLFERRLSLTEFVDACDARLTVLIDKYHFQRVCATTITYGFVVIYRFNKSVLTLIYSWERYAGFYASLGKAEIGSKITDYQEGYEYLLSVEDLCNAVDPSIKLSHENFDLSNLTTRNLMQEYLPFVAYAIETCAPEFLAGDPSAISAIAQMKR